ncbi:hypothetical protein L6164_027023 [Bauhinia variegata]|uniref:Uncharacterized protein n=1 Tax=Bauhinia variegata TaxID=167791 RepID=A0ACB9LS42_BAUVA|nr:hypothetical protein L6164_027023 [Bauhinia variegata]
MTGASAGDLLELVAQMEDFKITPNTASFNLVLKAMLQAHETEAAERLLERMLLTGKESLPDHESYDLLIGMLFLEDQIDSALKYIDLALKSGYVLSMDVFMDCVRSCVKKGRLDTVVTIIERCKAMDQNKALCPSWKLCNFMAGFALQEDNSKLAYYGLEFMARWIVKGEQARPPALFSVDEGLVVSALGTASRTYSSNLLDASWAILHRLLRQKKLWHAPRKALRLWILVQIYFQLENLSRAETPFKSVAALNCITLGCTNIWDLDRAYQTFEAIGSTFGLTPDIHSYNALMHAFGKLKKTHEASKVFEHFVNLGVKPNATSYSVLVDAHLINWDVKSALAVIDDMVSAGYEPLKEILKKVRRRCVREMDYKSGDRVNSLARSYRIRMGSEARRDLLFNLEYSTDYA